MSALSRLRAWFAPTIPVLHDPMPAPTAPPAPPMSADDALAKAFTDAAYAYYEVARDPCRNLDLAWTPDADAPTHRGEVSCTWCGARAVVVSAALVGSAESAVTRIARFAQAHRHPRIRPLSPAERETIRLCGVHRRGTLRLSPGGAL